MFKTKKLLHNSKKQFIAKFISGMSVVKASLLFFCQYQC